MDLTQLSDSRLEELLEVDKAEVRRILAARETERYKKRQRAEERREQQRRQQQARRAVRPLDEDDLRLVVDDVKRHHSKADEHLPAGEICDLNALQDAAETELRRRQREQREERRSSSSSSRRSSRRDPSALLSIGT